MSRQGAPVVSVPFTLKERAGGRPCLSRVGESSCRLPRGHRERWRAGHRLGAPAAILLAPGGRPGQCPPVVAVLGRLFPLDEGFQPGVGGWGRRV